MIVYEDIDYSLIHTAIELGNILKIVHIAIDLRKE